MRRSPRTAVMALSLAAPAFLLFGPPVGSDTTDCGGGGVIGPATLSIVNPSLHDCQVLAHRRILEAIVAGGVLALAGIFFPGANEVRPVYVAGAAAPPPNPIAYIPPPGG